MVAPTLVKITVYNPAQDGDAGTPFVGRAWFKASILRHIQGETPPDYVVTTQEFAVTFGEALMDGLVIVQPATPGVAWVYLEPTDYGPYADAWVWHIRFTSTNTTCEVFEGDYLIPTTGAIVDFGDLVPVAPPLPTPPAEWVIQLAEEVAARINGDADLQTQIDAIGAAEKAVSTDGSFGLPLPTGVGLEFVWTANVLDDIRYDGNNG